MGYTWCAAINCKNNSGQKEKRSFFRFPRDPAICLKWALACRRADFAGKDAACLHRSCKLCSDHFEDIMFLNDLKNRLHKHAVPTLFSFPNQPPQVTCKRKGPREETSDASILTTKRCKLNKSVENTSADTRSLNLREQRSLSDGILVKKALVVTPTSSAQMPSNVEVKASITDAQSIINKAAELSKSHGVCLEQQDTYFSVHQGRLKLRETLGDVAQLIFYERPDEEGPKLSNYSKQTFKNNDEAQGLKDCLSASLGVKGVVKKKRQLFMVGNTRVHIDNVDGLGDFMELEVMLQQNQSPEEGQKIAEDLMDQLGVPKEALICCSYIDLLLA